MIEEISGRALLKQVTKKDRILLVNPPVFDTRYSWLRWNQPLDLLRLGTYLRETVKCSVELFDYMLPNEKGRVTKQGLTGLERYRNIGEDEFHYDYPMWRFGQPFNALSDWLVERRAGNKKGEPTQVWITSLCSYWYPSVLQLCTRIRQWLPDTQIAVLGNFPKLAPEDALDLCDADMIVNKSIKHADKGSSLQFYVDQRPQFAAVNLNPKTAVKSIKEAVESGVYHIAIFDEDEEDNICRDKGQPLQEIVRKTEKLHRHLRFHAICGLRPGHVTKDLAKLFARKIFSELHFEQAEFKSGELDVDAYDKCSERLKEAGFQLSGEDKTSGFAWVGRPGEDLEGVTQRCFKVLDTFGSVILKPYTPVPGTKDYSRHQRYLEENFVHSELSPHFFPFAELNGITRNEYHDLYRMAAFLNDKVRGNSFELLNDSLGAELLRNSLRREAWNIESSPLSIID